MWWRLVESILSHRQTGLADSSFEFRQLLGRLGVFHVQLTANPLGHLGQERRVAEVEGRTVVHLGALEHAVEDFQLRDALARVVLHPAVLAQGLGREGLRYPAVALAEDADEVGPAVVDFLEADLQRLALFSVLFGDAPAEVNRE